MILNEHTTDTDTPSTAQPTAETQESTSPQHAASAESQAGSTPSSDPSTHENVKEPSMDDFATALENFTAEQEAEKQANEDRVLKGTVLKVTGTHVVVDIGSKSEGMVPIAQVQDHEGNVKFQPGDSIDVMIDKGETEEGYTKLSHERAQRLRAWDDIEKSYNDKMPSRASSPSASRAA